jgi:hypothetical protein
MSPESSCQELRRLAPELALGVAAGEDRALALEHLSVCAECRRHLAGLSSLADELLLLAPTQEPPVGFESRVIGAFAVTRRPPSRALLAGAAAVVLAVALTAGGLFAAFRDDRTLASHYRDILARANGQYFDAASLRDAEGDPVGDLFAYQGSPSWIVVTLRDPPSGTYSIELVTHTGDVVKTGSFDSTGDDTSWGGDIPIDLESVERVRLITPAPRSIYEAELEVEDE